MKYYDKEKGLWFPLNPDDTVFELMGGFSDPVTAEIISKELWDEYKKDIRAKRY